MSAATFDRIARAHLADPAVSSGRMFGSEGLKVNGKVFAMLVKDELVVKLPVQRCASLITSGIGRPFDPGHGRLMKEWASVPPAHSRRWRRLVDEARAYVDG